MDNCERMKVEGLTKKIMENLKEPTTIKELAKKLNICLLYTSPSPRD